MNKKTIFLLVIAIISIGTFFLFKKNKSVIAENKEEYERGEFVKDRLKYEFDILKDPATGEIPKNIFQKEIAFAKSLPVKDGRGAGIFSPQNLNAYNLAGPDNIGGRTRAFAIDKRFGTGTNKVILSGSVSGGIYRSADGGASWNKVTPQNEIHNVTSIAQDPRPGFQDTWYSGGGEAIGNSAADIGAFYLGFGILKSTDNGLTWTKLTLTVTNTDGSDLTPGTLDNFDNVFDIVHKIIVSPANGNVFIAGHRRLVRSTDGGSHFNVVFGSSVPATTDQGQMDIISNNAGKLYLAFNGDNPDMNLRGIWTSASGDFNSWVRIAGGKTLGVDSLPGWRANSYDTAGPKRILLALAPSQQNILFAFYQNGLSQQNAKGANSEADLFKIDFTANTSVNLSANMPDFPGQSDGVDPIALQGGYDMAIAVKPDDPNVVFVGGTNLYRSTDGFTSSTKTEWIGGYRKNNPPTAETYPNSHADFHGLFFDPINANIAFAINDGGIQKTDNIMANQLPDPVPWAMVSRYQTLQYNFVAIDPEAGQNNFFGGAQDNGTYFREDGNTKPNDQFKISGGDGASVSIASYTSNTFTIYFSSQFGSLSRDITNNFATITPSGLTANPDGGFGDFVTYFKTDFDNPEDLYYANFNRLFRTTKASTVTASGWEELTGVATVVNASKPMGTDVSIRALELSRGPYLPDHVLYIGTSDAHLYRLNDPRNVVVSSTPLDITPTGLTGNISDVAVNPNNDDEVLITVSNYNTTNIWYSKNAKSALPTWKNTEGNLTMPSIRSCVIVVKKDASGNPAAEYYVGTSVGLYSTTDINAASVTWEREGDNILGMALTTSLDYRPQDNTLLVGTHGNGMFYATTGAPNYNPNSGTVVDPNLPASTLIQNLFPTFTNTSLQYVKGNVLNVNVISTRIYNMAGQLVYSNKSNYQSGTIDVKRLPAGGYVLKIESDNGKYKFIKKFIKY
ncbi:MAG TPA: T9SS type A sorting domain-containing protein [Chitinophagaceae bacterium]|nr:T9SS type A sorting domain-containing protein [Chitinophagaceae bacterium]